MEASKLVVDSNIIIYHLRSKKEGESILTRCLQRYHCYASFVSEYELYVGVKDQRQKQQLDTLFRLIDILEIGDHFGRAAGLLERSLKRNRLTLSVKDLFIAVSCLQSDLPLMTTNVKHFQQIPGLQVYAPKEV